MTLWKVVLVVLFGVTYTRADNLALLSGTLRTYQQAGCDDEVVVLNCPTGTSISIELAQYGKAEAEASICKLRSTRSTISRSSYNYNSSCLWPNAIQYSLLQTVVEACQKKSHCKFQTSPKTFGGDPCPEVRKYVEVAYKCRPYEFRSQVACQNSKIKLNCNPNSRVAVYSASYGRTEYESIQCPQPQGVPEETCLVSYATEIVMQLCHGKRSCDLSADISTFGSPCKPESRMYLKVVYTCVPRKVLKEQYDGFLEAEEKDDEISSVDDNVLEVYEGVNDYFREFAASPPDPNIEGVTKENITKEFHHVGSSGPPQTTNNFLLSDKERLFIYILMTVAAIVVVLLSFLVAKIYVQHYRAKVGSKSEAANIADTSLPNTFVGDIDEVDADIELIMPLPPPIVPSGAVYSAAIGSIAEVVRYPHIDDYTISNNPRRLTLTMETDHTATSNSTSHGQYYYG
ncbi:protein eva-1 homolog C-like isoform X1 [Diabrotica virgifera virgifera]|uniref:SUEL-type lectin domain-containing protein n=1 Tax=Diabrotica virgifera virgifera TaxID=50390 RepID=A0ABM5L4K3_DIAVI|nr:protein eva-1 homolog C-like isoform X1 [Diabrotica virgifera virgifera]